LHGYVGAETGSVSCAVELDAMLCLLPFVAEGVAGEGEGRLISGTLSFPGVKDGLEHLLIEGHRLQVVLHESVLHLGDARRHNAVDQEHVVGGEYLAHLGHIWLPFDHDGMLYLRKPLNDL